MTNDFLNHYQVFSKQKKKKKTRKENLFYLPQNQKVESWGLQREAIPNKHCHFPPPTMDMEGKQLYL